jgi:hypothetical protein
VRYAQVRTCKAWIEREHLSFADAYADHAISGASPLRPVYRKLLDYVR